VKSIQEESRFFSDLFDMLSAHMGNNTELTLFDCNGNEPVIYDIRNGQISGRHTGDTGNTNESQPLSKGQENLGTDRRFEHLNNGHILRCSDFVIQGNDSEMIGIMEINQDITQAVEAERFLRGYNMYRICDSGICKVDIPSILDDLIQEALLSIGKTVLNMTREDKIEFVRILHMQGAFLVTKASTRVCSLLGISKYTLYNYINLIVNGKEDEDS